MTVYRLQDQRPRDDEEMRAWIADELGVRRGAAIAIGPDSVPVEVRVDQVMQHFWREKRDRWPWVPLIMPSIRDADNITPRDRGAGDKLYSFRAIVQDSRGIRLQPVATYIRENSRGRRRWKTTFPVAERALRRRIEQAGAQRGNARQRTEPRNPTPAPRCTAGGSRSGRPPVASTVYTMREQNSSSFWRDMLILSGLTLALGLMASHLAEVPT